MLRVTNFEAAGLAGEILRSPIETSHENHDKFDEKSTKSSVANWWPHLNINNCSAILALFQKSKTYM